MIRKKICMLGAYSVGKTSLVRRFVQGIFSERYLTTVGVKIDKKLVEVAGEEVTLLLWDLHGEDEFQKVRDAYMRGSSGYFLVVDGTRPSTLEVALSMHERARTTIGDVPCTLIVNKRDLESEWDVDEERLGAWEQNSGQLLLTSAKTGTGVEEAFHEIAKRMVAP